MRSWKTVVIIVVGIAVGAAIAMHRRAPPSSAAAQRAAAASHAAKELWLSDFESDAELTERWKLRDATAIRSAEQATHGAGGAQILFRKSDAPAAMIEDYFSNHAELRDWSRYASLRFDVHNPQASVERLIVQIKDGAGRRYKRELHLSSQTTHHITIPIAQLREQLNVRHIAQISLFQWKPKAPARFFLDAVRLQTAQAAGDDVEPIGAQMPLEDAAVTPNQLSAWNFRQQIARWQGTDAATGQPVVRVPLSLVTEAPLSVGFPVTGGVPLPMGQLQPHDAVRLVDPQGLAWPLQTRPLARWEDGSLKWLQVTTTIPPGAAGRDLWLEYGAPVAPPAEPAARVQVEETPEAVRVTTGPLQFSVSKQHFTLFESALVDRNRDGAFSEEERLAGAGDLVIMHQGRAFRSLADRKSYTLTVEERGPLRATLKASGWFRDEGGKGFCQFTVRLQAFAGLPQVRLYHTVIYTGYPANTYHHEYKDIKLPENETIEEIRLELPVTTAAGGQLLTADEQGPWAAPLSAPTVIHQHAHDAFRITQAEAVVRKGGRNEGWVLAQNETAGVMALVREAWQQYPKELIADPQANRLIIKLWPASAGELDLRTTKEAFGPDDVARGSAFGLGKTHEMVFGFLGVPVEAPTARSIAGLWQQPWLLAAHPVWLQATNVWGEMAPAFWEQFGETEALMDGLFNWADRQIRNFNWYGMLDWGDTRLWWRKEAYDKSYDEWGWHPEGRWGWHNCEAVGTHAAALVSFMRSLDLRYFRFGETKARHVMDVDTVHYNTVANDPRLSKKIPDTFAKVGSIHRHSANHWSGRNEEATHTHVLGLLMYYYLTGYDRAMDVANEVGGFLLQNPVTYTKHPDIAPLRGVSNVLWGDVLMYQATGDRRYRAQADDWIRVLLLGQREDGAWVETYNPRDRMWDGKVKTNYITLHTLPALIAYHRMTGNERVGKAIVRATESMFRREKYLEAFDAAGYSYLLTGKSQYLDEGRRLLRNVVKSQDHSGKPLFDGITFKKTIYDRVTPILYTVPLLHGAMTTPDFNALRQGMAAATPQVEPQELSEGAESRASPANGGTSRGTSQAPNPLIPYDVLVAPSLEKVLPERGEIPGAHLNPAQISLARNEYEAIQLVLHSELGELRQVRIEPGPLTHVGGQGTIPPDAISWSPVGFVKTRQPGYMVSHVGWWPDPLPAATPFDVKRGWTQPVWVTIYTPPGTPAGEYRGVITIRADNAAPTTIELAVHVWDFDLPQIPTLKTAFDVYLNRLQSGYSQFFPQWWQRWEPRQEELAERFYDDLLRHRLSPILNADLSDPAQLALVKRLRQRGLSAFAVGRHGGSFNNEWPKDDAALAELEPVYRRYAHELEQAGLLEAHYVYTYDEPELGLARAEEAGRMIRAASPKLKNLLVLYDAPHVGTLQQWLEPFDIVVLRNVTFEPIRADSLKRLGKEVWLYVSGPKPPFPTLVIDYPAMAYRILPWMCWKYGLSGLLYWSVNYWTTDPYKDPMNTQWEQNGNGSLYYPGPDGPVPSLRLEVLRDGLEDYEYLARLRQLVERVERLSAAQNDRQLQTYLAQAKRLLAVDDLLVKSMQLYARNPEALELQRAQLAEAIEMLQRVEQVAHR
ncbi:MAG: DUF4091 domain-containing protein [Candidatus Omnitrophica bacterium]|nr:DUF4091 domain-containing protein [Candidatus Omnitrophota bacterium]